MIPDDLFRQWVVLAQESFRLAREKNYTHAVAVLSTFLLTLDNEELKSEVMALRAEMMERQGRLPEAKSDLLAARSLSTPASYRKYSIELILADLCRKMGESEACVLWYLQALETVASDSSTSGATAVEGLIKQKGASGLAPDEWELCRKVLQQAWALFSLPGEPNLDKLPETLGLLEEAASRPLPAASRAFPPIGEPPS